MCPTAHTIVYFSPYMVAGGSMSSFQTTAAWDRYQRKKWVSYKLNYYTSLALPRKQKNIFRTKMLSVFLDFFLALTAEAD